ncbi:hypothetical protein KPG71_18825 [Roseovarius sp. PS-C2]|uniref:DUF7146 domain-containing protein n=1 Tax=Roseovarius sp. PS-C2 TaxID=2820814 RepID=UPI001C0BAD81|nr:primase-helicase zinc-binding domain-containing protein [Roseovarius sp. PS-C2]MBU3262080.1 hypothetical protein [Roseovarius sp. PS-C2]
MTVREDPRLAEAKLIPAQEMVDRLGIVGLRRAGQELSGPCPHCGGRDRFNINTRTGAFLCRQCDMRGGDVVKLVQEVLGLGFLDALSWICGERPAQMDAKQMEERRRRAAKAEEKRQREAARYREQAIRDARRIWAAAQPAEGTLVRDYLAARGITPELMPVMPLALRFIPSHGYLKKMDGETAVRHRGPAMIAGVLSPRGEIAAVHQTWIDPNPPHGKAKIVVGEETLPAKMVRGSKKGGAIRLSGDLGQFHTLVVAEGIETTLSAEVATGADGVAFWAGVDLGNMAGRMERVQGTRHSGRPDMSDSDAFVPPPGLKRMIFVQDGDSDPKATRAKMLSGLRRAMAHFPELRAQIVHAGAGQDLNDVLMGKGAEDELSQD